MNTWRNVGRVARREFGVRVRTRSFLFGTALLVLGVVAIALLPVHASGASTASTRRGSPSRPRRTRSLDRRRMTLDELLNTPTDGTTGDGHKAFADHRRPERGRPPARASLAGDYGAALGHLAGRRAASSTSCSTRTIPRRAGRPPSSARVPTPWPSPTALSEPGSHPPPRQGCSARPPSA